MKEITIALHDPMKDYLDAQLASGQFSDATEFFNHLLSEDQKRRAKEYLKAAVQKAEASGNSLDVNSEYWTSVRKRFHEKHGKGQAQ